MEVKFFTVLMVIMTIRFIQLASERGSEWAGFLMAASSQAHNYHSKIFCFKLLKSFGCQYCKANASIGRVFSFICAWLMESHWICLLLHVGTYKLKSSNVVFWKRLWSIGPRSTLGIDRNVHTDVHTLKSIATFQFLLISTSLLNGQNNLCFTSQRDR